MTPWVMALILANGLVYLVSMSNPAVLDSWVLIPALLPSRPWTAVTYMFLHAGLAHIFFNMFTLWMFGPPVEARLGGTRFISLYFVSGISGALLSLVTPGIEIVGASGAIFGVMLAFAMFWPRQKIYVWGIIGAEARVMVVIFVILSFFESGVAAWTHLGGFVGGWLYLRALGLKNAAARLAWQRKLAPRVSAGMGAQERWRKVNAAALHPVNREEYERVIAKLDTQGAGSLTSGEREFLDRFSQAAGGASPQ